MFGDARDVTDGSRLDTDVCVIGCGAAGVTLARQLAGTSTKVVVLESGDEGPDPRTQALFKGHSVGLPYFPLDEARLRYLGGATNHWGRLARPFDQHDFAAKPWVPNSGWPIGLNELSSYSAQAEKVVGLTDHEWATDAWVRKDKFQPLPLGDDGRVKTRVVQVISSGPRSLGERYRGELQAASNVLVYLHANVTSIEVDDAGRTVDHVKVAVLDGPRFTVRARQFVLAVGGIENARLLLASNSRFPAGLGNQNDVVGRYFLEHPRFVSGALVPTGSHLPVRFYETHNVGSSRIGAYLALSDKVLEQERLVDIQTRLAPVYTKEFADALTSREAEELRDMVGAVKSADLGGLVSHVKGVAADLVTADRYLVPGAPIPIPHPDVVSKLVRASPDEREALLPRLLGNIAAVSYREATGRGPVKQLDLVTRIDPVPNRDSRITLADDRDELGMPRVNLDWRLSALDRHSVRRSMEILANELSRVGLGRVRITFDEHDSTWPEDLAGGWHHMGTTRMNPDPKLGVVDENCQVHGVSNLYVAGSSVFPTSGSGTPTMLIIALAIRLTEHLRRTQ